MFMLSSHPFCLAIEIVFFEVYNEFENRFRIWTLNSFFKSNKEYFLLNLYILCLSHRATYIFLRMLFSYNNLML